MELVSYMNMNFDATTRVKSADEDNKRKLLESFESENQQLKVLLDQFYTQPNRTEQNYAEINEAILKAIDKLLGAGDWEGSLFLRNAAKPLKQARDEIVKLQQKMGAVTDNIRYEQPEITDDMQVVFVSIYQSGGYDLAQWEKQLASLANYTQGRPVYVSEDEVNRAIRAKLVPNAEAYIKVAIKKSRILTGLKPAYDRLHQPLLTLAEGAVIPRNILEFVHVGKHYLFVGGRLIAQ